MTNGIQEYLGSTWNFSISSASSGKKASFRDKSKKKWTGHISCRNLVDQKDDIAGSQMTIAFLTGSTSNVALFAQAMIHYIQRSFILGILRGMVVRSLEISQ